MVLYRFYIEEKIEPRRRNNYTLYMNKMTMEAETAIHVKSSIEYSQMKLNLYQLHN